MLPKSRSDSRGFINDGAPFIWFETNDSATLEIFIAVTLIQSRDQFEKTMVTFDKRVRRTLARYRYQLVTGLNDYVTVVFCT